jgi:uncharacterized membrane protein YphA (DoxX/SURF4 family)
MQQFLKIIRWIVGILFIFSGLIKANDPLGLSYKMQEFFEVWGMAFLNDYTLGLSIVMNIFEIVAGIALLIKFPYKWTLWLLFALIIFFSFLTGYALFSGKIKTCGCFGDCIPLTPKMSFIKDIILFVLISILLIQHKKVKTSIHTAWGVIILLLSISTVSYGQYYVLKHLPIIDCLPYKQGKDIVEQMKTPSNAIKDSVQMIFVYQKNGKELQFDMEHFPKDMDDSYQFIRREEKLIMKGNGITAPIPSFNLYTLSGVDTTSAIFANPIPYVLIVSGTISNEIPWKQLIDSIQVKYKNVYIVTADKAHANDIKGVQVLIADNTLIKTAARVWPTVFVMNSATIMLKQAYLDYLPKSKE